MAYSWDQNKAAERTILFCSTYSWFYFCVLVVWWPICYWNVIVELGLWYACNPHFVSDSFKLALVGGFFQLFTFFSGIPSWICHVPKLLSRSPLWGDARLYVPASTIPYPLPYTQPPVRLRIRLEHVETKSNVAPNNIQSKYVPTCWRYWCHRYRCFRC